MLVPGILAVSAVGVYAVHATTFDLVLMTALGVVGYLLRKQGVPMAPLILGFVLGDMMEQNLRRALSITNGDAGDPGREPDLDRPVAAAPLRWCCCRRCCASATQRRASAAAVL